MPVFSRRRRAGRARSQAKPGSTGRGRPSHGGGSHGTSEQDGQPSVPAAGPLLGPRAERREREPIGTRRSGEPRRAGPPGWLLERVLYRDALMLVIDKPAGLPVHAGPRGGDNLEDHLDALRFGLPRRPALAHRLDRDTSGCLVLGRHRQALARLGRLFADGKVAKTYWAVVVGSPPEPEGQIELALLKETTRAGWRMRPEPTGQAALTLYRTLATTAGLTWLELQPRTGRTHQIRVHCAALGCPVLGDPVYGPQPSPGTSLPPLHLHARAIALPLYASKPPITVTAEPPAPFAATLRDTGLAERSIASKS